MPTGNSDDVEESQSEELDETEISFFEEDDGEYVIPSPSLATTLGRGMNYDFYRAIADLVDNSIAANAGNVWIDIESKNGPSLSSHAFVSVTDDGDGMTLERLKQAMQYGAINQGDASDLGRFGLGMKTASTSISNILSVATRDAHSEHFHCRSWDLPWMREHKDNAWRLRRPLISNFPEEILSRIQNSPGTIIYLHDLTRLRSEMNSLTTTQQMNIFLPMVSEVMEYMGLIYH